MTTTRISKQLFGAGKHYVSITNNDNVDGLQVSAFLSEKDGSGKTWHFGEFTIPYEKTVNLLLSDHNVAKVLDPHAERGEGESHRPWLHLMVEDLLSDTDLMISISRSKFHIS